MTDVGYYMGLPYELSGAMAKGRFRYELLWGLKHMLNLYKLGKEFIVVFDYVCDVEVHLNNGFEFYQLKTQNNHGTYTIEKLVKVKKEKASVWSNLYKLKFNKDMVENVNTKVYIVSNAPLKASTKVYSNDEIVGLATIDEVSKNKLKNSLKEELGLETDVSLENSYFIKTDMNLSNPENEIIGELSIFFETLFKEECKNINSLYRLLSTEIFTKGCYEKNLSSYEDVIEKKGFTSAYLEQILNRFRESKSNSRYLKNTISYIEECYKDNFIKSTKMKRLLSSIINQLQSNKALQGIEIAIVKYIYRNEEQLNIPMDEVIEKLKDSINDLKPIEISEEEIEVLILLTLKKYEEGVYE